jgi:kynureninase
MRPTDAFQPDEDFARRLDAEDPLAPLRERFHTSPDTVYMLGNSLGLMPKSAEAAVERITREWRDLRIGGWLGGDPPWFYLAERTGEAAASLVGAFPNEVVCTGTTTYNIHSLLGTLYRPALGRTKIIACALDFPTDIYAIKSQMTLHGLDWRDHLVLIDSDETGVVNEDEIIDAMTEGIAIAHLPAVLFRSSQLLDIERLTAAAHEHGVIAGFDCSHSAGVVPHHLDEWDVDYAVFCGYKYLCGGPGAPAFIFLNRKFFECEPGLAGWFGYVKERQFDMSLDFEHARSAGGWQVSAPNIHGAAALSAALEVAREAGIHAMREKSLRMTSYLMHLVDELLSGEPYAFRVATPRDDRRRGGHVALTRDEDALRIKEALILRGVVADFRPPNVMRFAPSPLYSTYYENWSIARHLREIIDNKEYEKLPQQRKPIS